uniref:Solute carrier family 16 member 7 n=1 Tax=Nothobranchius furzeri TaxID=105023 RepID=A0A8C6PP14_NOTFU
LPESVSLDHAPSDGGWGWVVVVGAFISIGFSYAFPKSLTIYFKEIQEYFSISYSGIAWVSSLMLACMYAGGPVSSVLVSRYGSRPVVMVGGLMVSVAMVLASFATTVIHLYLCVGGTGGLGLAFNLQPSLTIISTYFQVKRPLANGLAMTGSPVILSILAPCNQFLFDSFGWRGSFLILGSIVLNCCVAGALMRPARACVQSKPSDDPLVCKEDAATAAAEVWSATSPPESTGDRFMDPSLLRHRGFLVYLAGNVVMFFGLFAPVVFLAPYVKHQGTDEFSAALLLSVFALADMFVRPVTGIIGNSGWIRPRIQYFFSFGLVVCTAAFGLVFGMLSALLFEALMDLVGAHRFSKAVGPVLLGPPISAAHNR